MTKITKLHDQNAGAEKKPSYIERVASGLRKMNKRPDAILYLDEGGEQVCDAKYICNIPIYRTGVLLSSSFMDSYDCPFAPLFFDDSYNNTSESAYFIKGYEDCL